MNAKTAHAAAASETAMSRLNVNAGQARKAERLRVTDGIGLWVVVLGGSPEPLYRLGMKRSRGETTRFMTGLGRPSPLRSDEVHIDNRPLEVMSPERRDAVLRGLEAVRSGDIATEDEVQAVLARYRL